MLWIAILIVALDALLLALLAVPLGIEIDKSARQPARQFCIYWLFGRWRIPVHSSAAIRDQPERERARRTPVPRPVRRQSGKPSLQVVMAFVTSEGLLARFGLALRRLARAFVVKEARVHVRFGLDDPADTGMLYACLSPIPAVCAAAGSSRVVITPEFSRAEWDYRAQFKAEFVPLRIVTALLGFLFAREVRTAIVRAWKAR